MTVDARTLQLTLDEGAGMGRQPALSFKPGALRRAEDTADAAWSSTTGSRGLDPGGGTDAILGPKAAAIPPI